MDKESRYANLVTVIAVVSVVVYAQSEYDIWDVIVSIIGGSYVVATYRLRSRDDLFEVVLTSFLTSICLVIFVFSILPINQFLNEYGNPPLMFDWESIVTFVLTAIISLIIRRRNK